MAGSSREKNFGQNVTQPPGFNLERLPQILEDSHARLARVQIEHLPYDQILERYDRPTTFFYLDPPYYEKYLYRFNLKPEEFVLLRDRLKKLKGKFILSLNDVPEVRKIFSDFQDQERRPLLHRTAESGTTIQGSHHQKTSSDVPIESSATPPLTSHAELYRTIHRFPLEPPEGTTPAKGSVRRRTRIAGC